MLLAVLRLLAVGLFGISKLLRLLLLGVTAELLLLLLLVVLRLTVELLLAKLLRHLLVHDLTALLEPNGFLVQEPQVGGPQEEVQEADHLVGWKFIKIIDLMGN